MSLHTKNPSSNHQTPVLFISSCKKTTRNSRTKTRNSKTVIRNSQKSIGNSLIKMWRLLIRTKSRVIRIMQCQKKITRYHNSIINSVNRAIGSMKKIKDLRRNPISYSKAIVICKINSITATPKSLNWLKKTSPWYKSCNNKSKTTIKLKEWKNRWYSYNSKMQYYWRRIREYLMKTRKSKKSLST